MRGTPLNDARENPGGISTVTRVLKLTEAIRNHGHLAARLDPLGRTPKGDASLELATYGLAESDLENVRLSFLDDAVARRTPTARDAVDELRRIYCSTLGFDFEHLHEVSERDWLREVVEAADRKAMEAAAAQSLLERLTSVEAFELFLQRAFPGKTRFSLEGLDMLVPILDSMVSSAANSGYRFVFIGMAHRGRLNVLTHVLGKPYSEIFAEFRDPVRSRDFHESLGWTGDAKYHYGAQRALRDGQPADVLLSMPPNPSHVEAIHPVVLGMARACGQDQTLAIVVHGDAAFPGQGVVAEALNLSRLRGYSNAGTLHILANNQIGYTTDPADAFSTRYASDIARGFEIPVIHANADDPEACLRATQIAFDYIQRFHKDFVVDLVGYRRRGHNEGDEPSFTQPILYKKISDHRSVREIWSKTLERGAVIAPGHADALFAAATNHMREELETLKPEQSLDEPQAPAPPPGAARRAQTAISLERLRQLHQQLMHPPHGFQFHPKLDRLRKRRQSVLDSADERTVDWGAAEELAMATILSDGVAIRLTGEDVQRGTFSHRHAVFFDVETGREYLPLHAIASGRAMIEIWNSPLTENATLLFEYGFNIQSPGILVIWEAQYGDFINNGQMMVDEFLCSARAKWGQTPSLVLLLPHGLEGNGPDHSTGRLERFLQLAAENNMRIVNCTTAAQYFHLLRRQAALLQTDPLPLVVFTPKSLLRHPATASSPRQLAEGKFELVLDDADASSRRNDIRRIVVCSGKIFIDLKTNEPPGELDTAVVRVEQLYPFPEAELHAALDQYPNIREVTWLQEEPENMGALEFVWPRLQSLTEGRWELTRVSRPRNASPAEGSLALHTVNQSALVERVLRSKEKIHVDQNPGAGTG